MDRFEVVVIGAGAAGYAAALRAAEHGRKVAVVERGEAGGTCVNRGCVPTKALLHESEICRIAGREPDAEVISARRDDVSSRLRAGVEGLLSGAKIPLIRGDAVITAPGEVRVGDETIEAEHIVIAAGSRPARPPIPGLDLPGVVTSDDLLTGVIPLPKSIVIIGGGVIGVEFATFYTDLGRTVTIVEGLPTLLPQMDRELGRNLQPIMKRAGAGVFTNAKVSSIERDGDELDVIFSDGSAEHRTPAEMVLCAIGRVPCAEGLFGEGLAPEMAGRSIAVDERFRTSVDGVYAVGDVSSRVQLAHVATAQAEACIDMICGVEPRASMDLIPSCVYCRPEIASVGMTEAQAKELGVAVKIGKCAMHANARTMIADAGRSFMKVLADPKTKRVVGAQLMCGGASDMIGEFCVSIANELTPRDMLRAMRPHPTFEESIVEALKDLDSKLG